MNIGDRVYVMGLGTWARIIGIQLVPFGGPVTGVRVVTDAHVEHVVPLALLAADSKPHRPRIAIVNSVSDWPSDTEPPRAI